MSSSIIDPYKAAKIGALQSLKIAPKAMSRLSEVVKNLEETTAELRFFWDEQKRLRVTGQVAAQMDVLCQRCLEPMPLNLEVAVNAAVVWTEEQVTQLSSELEPWIGEEERVNAQELLEDELLLALPIMPAHEQQDCEGLSSFTTEPNEEPGERQKPFADLASLIKTTDD
ncbi:MAG: hypothetical protein HOL48_00090 [Porticoccaceae bacterium]|jgi:uncharacterized protein|nr:hypothetical protein [Porticoccaceae bacterium]